MATVTYKTSSFPIPILSFGDHFCNTDFEQFQTNCAQLKKLAAGTSTVLKYGQKFVPQLQRSAEVAGNLSSVVSVVLFLVKEVDKLNQEIKKLEQKVFCAILDGKIQALNRKLRNIQDTTISEVQLISDLGNAISNLDEVLPLFANSDSIFRERYYVGAPLFVSFCAIFKGILIIAEYTDYKTNLEGLKQGYQEMLDWYRVKCIGTRLASCYVKSMLSLPGDSWTYDWKRHYENYKKYYEKDSLIPWQSYSKNLGGKSRRVWYERMTCCRLYDTWDTRSRKQVKLEFLELQILDGSLMEKFMLGSQERDIRFFKEVLAEYRRRVEEIMIRFFNDVSIIT